MPRPSPFALALLVIILMLISVGSEAALKKEYTDLEKLYTSGKLDELANAISTAKPTNDEERAFIGYYSALLKRKKADAIKAYEWVISKYPTNEYAQISLLELAKLSILERDIKTAVAHLRKISSNAVLERYYWLALCSWWQDDFAAAITNAETYLRLAPKGAYAEDAHYLIAECYIAQKKGYSAISTLQKLLNTKQLEIDEQYLYYRLGYAYELSDKLVDAVQYYRSGYELDKYSQIAYLIEDRLFELRYKSRNIDISFLYPYSLLQISPPTPEAGITSPTVADSTKPPGTSSAEWSPNLEAPIKLKTIPNSGYYLQAGRFSQEANANKLVINIRLLSIPSAYYEDTSGGKKTWVVVCGEFPDRVKAEEAKNLLKSKEINSFLIQH